MPPAPPHEHRFRRRSGSRAAHLLVVAASVLAAARAAHGAVDGEFDVLRLGDLLATARGTGPTRLTLDHITRPVLPAQPAALIYVPGWEPHPRPLPDGSLQLIRPCPAPFLGREVAGVLTPAGLEMGRFRCPPSAGEPVDFRFSRSRDPAKLIAALLPAGPFHVKTGVVRLPPGAMLRTFIGPLTDTSPERIGHPRIRVLARNATGRAATVLDRRIGWSGRPETRWVEVRADLAAAREALGPDVRLVLTTVPDESAEVPAYVAWADPTILWPRPTAEPRRWNVLLVSLDTLRADRVGAYGATRAKTPLLDQLAAEGTRFETVIAPAPWTHPSHASMFTGLYTCVHGSVGTPYGAPLAPYAVPLAEYLRTAGYSTAAVAEDVWLEAATFVRGFEFYRENRDSSNPDRSRQTIEWAVDWLHRQATAPFFLFVHTYQAHEPYFAPPQIRAAFGLGPELLPVTAPTEPLLAQYDAAVTYTDTKLAPLLAALDDLGLRERTIVVATSDHGEAFREHGYVGHGRSLHEEVLRVPMIWRAPGLVGAGRRVEGQVSLIDLTPTLLDLLGVPPGGGFQGISLAPSLRAGGPENAPGDRVLFSENTLEFYRLAIRTPGWKALLERGTTEIFHLDRDPGEHSPDAPEALVAEAAQKAAAFEQECARRKTRLEQAAAGRPVEPAMPPDPDLVRRLKALGYTERETTR